MAADIVPELLDAIQTDFNEMFAKDETIQFIKGLIRKGSATYSDMNAYAIRTGELLADVFKRHLTSNDLPDGKMYYNIAERILTPTLKNNHEIIASAAAETQEILNKSAGIRIKAIKPKVNNDRISGLIEKVSEADNFDDVAWVLDEPVINFSQSVIDAAIKESTDFHYRAGLSPKIVRTAVGNVCKWCANLAGTYEYEDVKETGNDVFRRHRFCKCIVEYVPPVGKRRNVHSHKDSGSSADVEGRKKIVEKQKKALDEAKKLREKRIALAKSKG